MHKVKVVLALFTKDSFNLLSFVFAEESVVNEYTG